MQERTIRIIEQDNDLLRAYEKAFGVEMPSLAPDGTVRNLPSPYPRVVNGVERGGHRIAELGRAARSSRMPALNPILGRNTAEETMLQSKDMYRIADELGIRLFHFVHAEATRHIDPLDGAELIEQSRGKGGITPAGERRLVELGGGVVHPMRINATGDTPHLSILNAFLAGFDGTDIGPVIHVHFCGRGIDPFRVQLNNGYKALEICAENGIFVQLDSHKHLNNIEGTDGMALGMCVLSEGLAVLAGLPASLSALQINLGGRNLLADLALMRAFREVMWSEFLIAVPETFQNPPDDPVAEQAHFARMAFSARLGGADFYRPKAAEAVGIPTGASMGRAVLASHEVFKTIAAVEYQDPAIDRRKDEVTSEAMAVVATVLGIGHELSPDELGEGLWHRFSADEVIARTIESATKGVLDAPLAAAWDLKRAVKTHRDTDGVRRYVPGFGPEGLPETDVSFSREVVSAPTCKAKPTRERVVLATVGADAHVIGINTIKEAFENAGYDVIYLRGMNLPETVAEVAAETGASVVGASNLLGLGMELFPRLNQRLQTLGIRDRVLFIAGGRLSEKEEEQAEYVEQIGSRGPGFLGVDAFYGPGTDPADVIRWVENRLGKRLEVQHRD